MIFFLIASTILILVGLPTLLVISACMGASQTTQNEENVYL
jgi:hypothetical protein